LRYEFANYNNSLKKGGQLNTLGRKDPWFGGHANLPLLAEAELIGDCRRNAGGQQNEK
jgi:hypothetical protein